PPEDRRALARAFVAKALLGVSTTRDLIERLDVDKSLRRILGWEGRAQVPSESTFSRAFAAFAQGDLPSKMHAALIERSLGGRIIGAIARDATEIEARETPVKKDEKDDPPPPRSAGGSPPTDAEPQKKRGRPRFGQGHGRVDGDYRPKDPLVAGIESVEYRHPRLAAANCGYWRRDREPA